MQRRNGRMPSPGPSTLKGDSPASDDGHIHSGDEDYDDHHEEIGSGKRKRPLSVSYVLIHVLAM
jgi:hypothetical protein